jgi:hypothetical protein
MNYYCYNCWLNTIKREPNRVCVCVIIFFRVRTAYSITLLYEFLFILFVASQGASLILEGRHNADIGWISELRSGDAWV